MIFAGAQGGQRQNERRPGTRPRAGRISKAGGSRARTLLVEAAWALLRWRTEKNKALYDWAMRIAARRGRARACVALARKLASILYALWRDETEFDPHALRQDVIVNLSLIMHVRGG